VEGLGVDLIQLVKVTVHHCVLREAVLGPGTDDNVLGDFFTSGSLVVCLIKYNKIVENRFSLKIDSRIERAGLL
jgi:hypothetical protein